MHRFTSFTRRILSTALLCLAIGATTAPAGAATADPARTAFDYFLHKGLSKAQAAGIVGNLMQESNVNPSAVEYHGPGRGIAQWGVGQRWDTAANNNLIWFANRRHASRYSLTTQLDFIWYELTSFQQYGLRALRAAGNVAAATKAFQDHFEVCGACNATQRINDAQKVLRSYGTGR
jgi:hypothetical protein